MRIALWLLFGSFMLNASEIFTPYSLEYTTIMHSEYESSMGKDNSDAFPSQSNSYVSWYNILSFNYDVNEDLYLTLGGKANLVLGEDTYTAPMYLRGKLTSDQLDRAIVSEASINYDNGFFSISAGRSDIDYDWLLGSMDGIIASVGSDESVSLRLFWFQNFTPLQYNYYFKLTTINDSEGFYGAIAKAQAAGFDMTFYDYYMHDLRNVTGVHINYTADRYALNISYSSGKALSQALYGYDESLAQISLEWLINKHFFEVGGSITGKNGLLAMIQLGSFMSGQFYLSNQIDRENAKNGYLRYLYAKNRWRFELLGGYTSYDNTFLSMADGLSSYETDCYLGYSFNNSWSLGLGAMYMNVDDADPISVDQYLTTLNVGYRYELF